MPYTVMQEYMGYFDAIRKGTARNNVTIAAALSDIGSSPATLVLTMAGDGVWTLSANTTIPANVTLLIPPGVTVFRATGVTLTLNGPVLAHQPNWETGPGITVRNTTAPIEMSAMKTSALTVNTPLGAQGLLVTTPGLSPAPSVGLNTGLSGGNNIPFITLYRDPAVTADNWVISNNLNFQFSVSHAGQAARLAVTDQGTWIGDNTITPNPSHMLQLAVGDAFMPGGGPWGNSTSDARLKKNVSDFTMGLAVAVQLVSKYYEYNGLGDTVDDGKQYVGFIADDLVAIVPHMVGHDTTRKLHPDDPTTTDFYTTNEGSLVHILLNAVKELATRVEALEAVMVTTRGAGESEESAEPRAPRRRHS
jgi:hypothetical protein